MQTLTEKKNTERQGGISRLQNKQIHGWDRILGQQTREQSNCTHPRCSPAWTTHASSRKLQAQMGSWARMHSEQLWRRPQLVVFTCVTSVLEPIRSQPYGKGIGKGKAGSPRSQGHIIGSRLRCLSTRLRKIYNSHGTISCFQWAEALGTRPDLQGH